MLCSAVQAKVNGFLDSKLNRGVTLAGALAKHRGSRNPDFLRKMVEHFEIQEYGSCFSKECFDLEALSKEDFYDRLAEVLLLFRKNSARSPQ